MVYVLDINRIYDLWRCPIPNKVENAGPPSSLVASTQTKHVARYSPNGKEILYVSFDSGNPEIWICNSDGSHPFQLTRLGGPDPGSPCWSPDGQQIVFTVHSGNQRDVYLIPAQGGRPQQLTRTPFNERSASFSRNGKSIYFESNRSGEEQIWKMPVEGGEQVQVTRKGGWHNAGESMDGKNLFYWKRKAPEPDVGELWKVSVDGGEEIRVLESVSSANFDVKEHGIYYARSSGNSWRWETAFFYYQFNDGKTVPIATIQKAVAYGFSVSPDERWILYTQAEWDFARSNLMLVENLR
jgi:Tol biopolymer transport system component